MRAILTHPGERPAGRSAKPAALVSARPPLSHTGHSFVPYLLLPLVQHLISFAAARSGQRRHVQRGHDEGTDDEPLRFQGRRSRARLSVQGKHLPARAGG